MIWKRLPYLLPWRRRAAERDMREELQSLATMAAPGELGNLTLAAEDARAEWGWTRLEQLGQDLRYALRTLRKSPIFAATTVLSLAIGIGATTSLFTLIDAVMWKLLPVANPGAAARADAARTDRACSNGFTYQQYEIVRDHVPRLRTSPPTPGCRSTSASTARSSRRWTASWSPAATSRCSACGPRSAGCSDRTTTARCWDIRWRS